jgi:L-alanine-DL-glutamate epimerase-like enolase superfamily enzyme
MIVSGFEVRRAHLPLSRPYRIAGRTTDAVEVFRLLLRTDDGTVGLGAATPEPSVTAETPEACARALEENSLSWLVGTDVRRLGAICREAGRRMRGTPGALAAVDIALHDLFARGLGVPLADALGRVHDRLPTSVTIGIQEGDDAMALAAELVARGFRYLKIKVGESLERDVELVSRLYERYGGAVRIRADANVGYTPREAVQFLERTEKMELEFLEQPVRARNDGLRQLPEPWRSRIAADESLVSERDAIALAAATPSPACGIFNIKLMKCGGIRPAMRIAAVAESSGIDLMWGCMDESVISISAALHVALASPATKYLDLDGSFDLARDVAGGGFVLESGDLRPTEAPGLGAWLLEGEKS